MEHVDPNALKRTDFRNGRPCEFCQQLDSNFGQRKPMDQIVSANRKQTASAHLTEDGYVRHRWLELSKLVAANPRSAA